VGVGRSRSALRDDHQGVARHGLRLGYLAGAGAQPPGVGGGDGDGASRWRLGTLVWGGAADGGAGAASGADSGATAPPAAPWGSFGYAWRGSESSEGDALKIGRAVLGASDAFAGLGWTIGYDGAERVAEAVPGAGSLAGGGAEGGGGSGAGGAGSGSSPEGMGADAYSYEYGIGDELTRRIDQRTGELESVVSGADGRLLALDGETFGYDPVGRRTEDARFRYQWSWRGELVRLDVKEGAEEAWGSPYEGHMVRYAYDALGRLTSRTHWGPLPEGEIDDTLRPFVERRDYVWDQQSRVAEIGSNDPEGTQVRWRKLYVPGPGGLDDAVQVVVQNVDGSEALYSILRDEIGSVIALVAEDETREGAGGTVDPTRPVIPVRYRYSPFGAALAETSPRVERLLFDNELVEVGGFRQADAPERDDAVAAAGALRVWFSAALDAATLGAGVVLESRTAGGAWTEVPAATPGGTEGLALALDPETGTELRVLLVEGWRRGVAYRVRLRAELRDVLGRAPPTSGPGGSASAAAPLQWTVPEGEGQAIAYEQRFASGERFESWASSGDTVGGRFPGGQNGLFHGLWTDPVSGISYARARWYDARTGSFLSEDPLRDVDSPNLYQYAGHNSFNATDPLGLCFFGLTDRNCWDSVKQSAEFAKTELQRVANAVNSIPQQLAALPQTAEKVLLAPSQAAMAVMDCVGRPGVCAEAVGSELSQAVDDLTHYFDQPVEQHAEAWGDALVVAVEVGAGATGPARGLSRPRGPPTTAEPPPPARPQRGPNAFDRSKVVRSPFKSNREKVLERDPICHYCQSAPATTADHVISAYDADAVVGAGIMTYEEVVEQVNALENLLGACRSCNSSKGDMLPGNIPGTWRPTNPSPEAIEIMKKLESWVDGQQ
jgi:RHS repeat-associated protein